MRTTALCHRGAWQPVPTRAEVCGGEASATLVGVSPVSHHLEPLPDVLPIVPLSAAPDIAVRIPGSKSITNRALLCAALAEGRSVLRGALFADDTLAMVDVVNALGATVTADEESATLVVDGVGRAAAGRSGVDERPGEGSTVQARDSGTTSRFILPAVALSPARRIVDGNEQLRVRPFAPLLDALVQLGVDVEPLGVPGFLPVAVTGPARGGPVRVPGHLSSQFLSGLLLAGPLMPDGLDVELTSPLVSVPYVEMTAAVMRAFGVETDGLVVTPSSYRAGDYAIEPDASAASYFVAAAAITGGRITIEGLGTNSIQGDARFAEVLEAMGAKVERSAGSVTVVGTGELHGVDIDMADISDTAQTLAAVATFADTPTRVRGIGFIRGKEVDRIGLLVAELRRAGIDAIEHDDGFTVNPGPAEPTRFDSHGDHRMAMSLSLIGLRTPGIEIAGPACVAKTYPRFFEDLASLH
jgi:3-phosphoshikimate 1-carboxyvinyltransferase